MDRFAKLATTPETGNVSKPPREVFLAGSFFKPIRGETLLPCAGVARGTQRLRRAPRMNTHRYRPPTLNSPRSGKLYRGFRQSAAGQLASESSGRRSRRNRVQSPRGVHTATEFQQGQGTDTQRPGSSKILGTSTKLGGQSCGAYSGGQRCTPTVG